jgi:hypothetical protein
MNLFVAESDARVAKGKVARMNSSERLLFPRKSARAGPCTEYGGIHKKTRLLA